MIRSAQSIFAIVAATSCAHAQSRHEIRLGPPEIDTHGTLSLPVYLSSTELVDGFAVAFEWDAGGLAGSGFSPGEVLSQEGVAVTWRARESHAVVAAVMDERGLPGRSIPPGNDILLVTMRALCRGPTTFRFADLRYTILENGPLIENYVIVGGIDISLGTGLILTGTELDDCEPGEVARRVPGDCNADGMLDIADGVCVLGVLFLGTDVFPCGDTEAEPGNHALLDWQRDGAIDIADAVAILGFLFLNSAPHPAAVPGNETEGCVPMTGCDGAVCL